MAFLYQSHRLLSTKIRNIILLVKDTAASASFYKDAIGVSIKVQTSDMVELETGGTSIILKESNTSAAHLTTGMYMYTYALTYIYSY
jgi:catechol-2,3-dioxygenase